MIGAAVFYDDPIDPDYVPALVSAGTLFRLWNASLSTLDKCWDLFQKHYLTALHERYQLAHKQGQTSHVPPKEGAIVLIEDGWVRRGYWKLGRIIKLHQRSDGSTSTASLQLPSGKVISRSIKFLYPLEVDAVERENVEDVRPTSITEQKRKLEDKPHGEDLTRRPITRSMTKNLVKRSTTSLFSSISTHSLFFVVICLMFLIVYPIHSLECKNGVFDVIESHECVTEGIVVKRAISGTLCWTKIVCRRNQHLRKGGMCGSRCPCPNWATDCSYNSNPSKLLIGNREEILSDSKPNVCSFTPEPLCNEIHLKIDLPKFSFMMEAF
ncbi:MAG: hypothetical protein GY696_29295, partial [Gammaproteobacteria bacterium]|nr:hypothetical protein [Gammaproteobacteria bacterium]